MTDRVFTGGYFPIAVGPTGPQGPIASTIPFSISKYGVEISTDAQGNPSMVAFSGFGSSYNEVMYLKAGEWATGTITIDEDMYFGVSFIMPHPGTIKKIHVLFCSDYIEPPVEEGASMIPFVCLAVSETDDLVYRILPDTLTKADPYIGGVDYPKHTIKRGASPPLNIEIAEGSLVAIVVGIMAENATVEQRARFMASGGIFLE